MVTSVVEQTIAKVRGQKPATTAKEETTYKSPDPAGLSDSKPSESRSRRGYRGQRGKKYARAVEQSVDASPRRTSELSSAIADVHQFQNMQSELTKLANERGKLLADRERMSKEMRS